MSAENTGAALVACAICHVVDTRELFPDAEGPARLYPVVQCVRCGLAFQRVARTEADLEEAQRDAYGRPQSRFSAPVELFIRGFRSARLRLAQRLLPPNGRVLDVGCGRGLFLRMLRDRGYEVRGTELSAATAANAYPDVPIDVGELRPGLYPDHAFDLISIWHVLEHLREPDVALRVCAKALAPGGALILALPNFGSTQARLGGAQWFHLDLPRHIFHFTRETLTRLLHDHGLMVERCRTGQWEMDPFGLLQTVLNRAGLRHNALYDTLSSNEQVKRDLSRGYRMAMLALFPLGMALAIPVSLWLRLTGRAGTLLVIARKGEGSDSPPSAPPSRDAARGTA